eukprot:8073451-Pyramimonas_sp.AAC.1
MAAYGCARACTSSVPSPKRLTYGHAHTWDPAFSANPPSSNLNGCRSAYPQNPQFATFCFQW